MFLDRVFFDGSDVGLDMDGWRICVHVFAPLEMKGVEDEEEEELNIHSLVHDATDLTA